MDKSCNSMLLPNYTYIRFNGKVKFIHRHNIIVWYFVKIKKELIFQ